MADTSVNPNHAPASILDIITFGYKSAFKTLAPVSKMALPCLVLYTLGQSYWAIKIVTIQTRAPQEILSHLGWVMILAFVFTPVFLYLHYCVTRYVRDCFWAEPEQNAFRYLLPKKSLWGALGIFLLTLVAIGPVMLIGMIGLLFLIAPGLIVFSYFYSLSSLTYVSYLSQPEQGVMIALANLFRLLKGNFWRTVALGLLSFTILVIISLPLNFFQQILASLGKYNPSFMNSWYFYALYTLNMLAMVWFNLTVGYVGTMFVLNRYFADLQARAAEGAALPLNFMGYQTTQPSGLEQQDI